MAESNDTPVISTDGIDHYAEKWNSLAFLFPTLNLLVYAGECIWLDKLTYCGIYRRYYWGDGESEVSKQKMYVKDGKKRIKKESYTRSAGSSWGDYSSVMESDDYEELIFVTDNREYNFKGEEFDADVWRWLADYFPDAEEQA